MDDNQQIPHEEFVRCTFQNLDVITLWLEEIPPSRLKEILENMVRCSYCLIREPIDQRQAIHYCGMAGMSVLTYLAEFHNKELPQLE